MKKEHIYELFNKANNNKKIRKKEITISVFCLILILCLNIATF